jgi:cell division protein FtsQ
MPPNELSGGTSKPVTTTVRRSDIVRARRQRRSNNSRSQNSGQAQPEYSRNMPPTFARGVGAITVRQTTRTRQHTRLRISVPLNSPGLELKLPALPKVMIGWRLLSGVMWFGLAWMIYTLWASPMFMVSQIEITNDQIMDPAEIEEALQVQGRPVFTADPNLMEDKLTAPNKFPELADARVSIGFPARVLIRLNERKPVIYWKQDEMDLWVDADGISFPSRGQDSNLVKVVASGVPGAMPNSQGQDRLMMPEMVKAIVKLQGQVPEGQTIIYDAQHGLGWSDPRGWKVYFGNDPDNMEIRLAVYQSVVDLLAKRKINPALVSVEYIHAPYYRLSAGK